MFSIYDMDNAEFTDDTEIAYDTEHKMPTAADDKKLFADAKDGVSRTPNGSVDLYALNNADNADNADTLFSRLRNGKIRVNRKANFDKSDEVYYDKDLLEPAMLKGQPDILDSKPDTALFWSKMRIVEGNSILKEMEKSDFWSRQMPKMKLVFNWSDPSKKHYRAQEIGKLFADNAFITIRETLDNKGYEPRADIWSNVSEVFANQAKGAVFFVEGPEIDNKPAEKKIWAKTELPTLMKNPNVPLIAELDFLNPDMVKSIIIKECMKPDMARNYGLPEQIAQMAGEENLKIEFVDDGFRVMRVDEAGQPQREPVQPVNEAEQPLREPVGMDQLAGTGHVRKTSRASENGQKKDFEKK